MSYRYLRRSLVALLALVTSAGFFAGAGQATKDNAALILVLPTANANYLVPYVAWASGLFAADNITVVDGVGTAAIPPGLLGGTWDVAVSGTLTPLNLAKQNEPAVAIYAMSAFGAVESLVAVPPYQSIADLAKLQNCTIATFPPGSPAYGAAEYLVTKGGLSNCTLATASTATGQLALMASGQAQARVGAFSDSLPFVQAGKANTIIGLDPAQIQKYFGSLASYGVETHWPEVVFWGLSNNLKSKASAVIAFIRDLGKAWTMVEKSTPEQVTQLMYTLPTWANSGIDESTTETLVKGLIPVTSPDAGFISRDAWHAALRGAQFYGVAGYSPADPAYAYDSVVDMSYYDQAIGIPFIASLAAANEVPPATGASKAATGSFSATVATTNSGATLSWALNLQGAGVKTVTMALHKARKGVRGPTLAVLCTSCKTNATGTLKATAAEITQLTNGKVYVELSTPAQPNGIVRGQIYPGSR